MSIDERLDVATDGPRPIDPRGPRFNQAVLSGALIVGFLFSYNFLPKSWIYFAINEVRERGEDETVNGIVRPGRMDVAYRAAVLKIKYLYYF